MSHRRINVRISSRLIWPATIALLLPTLASAHAGHDYSLGFFAGLTHPFLGVDHLLAMIAVGIWSVQHRGRAMWLFPVTFVAAMALGAALGLMRLPMPATEHIVQFSVLALGLIVACVARLPMAMALPLLALFAAMHGHAHAVEIPRAAAAGSFVVGMLGASAMLHVSGILAARAASVLASAQALRWMGGAIAGAGVLLLVQ